ncbi:3-oxoacyl-(acyl-carrier-protein) reductase 1 [uncultured delta proteobacterium]|uniref:3-oxoacyl-(Acyl-carrier-protein) reductase 1 n=1 Tax=uncultured delta proteobacterium TaxID=34034 RepID=A0A212JVG6_9DELT|nr:3-oxoacyl-(acyl-carrier-protein) reductase 1 [uncultured delta proteobacterium]
MLFSLAGKVAIVTGCGKERGLGRAAALALGEQGATVIAADLEQDAVETTAAAVRSAGGKALALQLDVTSQESVDAMIKRAMDEFGRIDILVNNAGMSQRATIYELEMEDVRKLFEINWFGLFRCTKAAIDIMRKQQYGRIINMASAAGKQGGGFFGGPHYSASKAAVLGFSKNVARQTATDGITCNCICPGLIHTDMWSSMPKDAADRVISVIPMGRPGNPPEVAAAIAFLASDEASYITGEDIDVNGGTLMD